MKKNQTEKASKRPLVGSLKCFVEPDKSRDFFPSISFGGSAFNKQHQIIINSIGGEFFDSQNEIGDFYDLAEHISKAVNEHEALNAVAEAVGRINPAAWTHSADGQAVAKALANLAAIRNPNPL